MGRLRPRRPGGRTAASLAAIRGGPGAAAAAARPPGFETGEAVPQAAAATAERAAVMPPRLAVHVVPVAAVLPSPPPPPPPPQPPASEPAGLRAVFVTELSPEPEPEPEPAPQERAIAAADAPAEATAPRHGREALASTQPVHQAADGCQRDDDASLLPHGDHASTEALAYSANGREHWSTKVSGMQQQQLEGAQSAAMPTKKRQRKPKPKRVAAPGQAADRECVKAGATSTEPPPRGDDSAALRSAKVGQPVETQVPPGFAAAAAIIANEPEAGPHMRGAGPARASGSEKQQHQLAQSQRDAILALLLARGLPGRDVILSAIAGNAASKEELLALSRSDLLLMLQRDTGRDYSKSRLVSLHLMRDLVEHHWGRGTKSSEPCSNLLGASSSATSKQGRLAGNAGSWNQATGQDGDEGVKSATAKHLPEHGAEAANELAVSDVQALSKMELGGSANDRSRVTASGGEAFSPHGVGIIGAQVAEQAGSELGACACLGSGRAGLPAGGRTFCKSCTCVLCHQSEARPDAACVEAQQKGGTRASARWRPRRAAVSKVLANQRNSKTKTPSVSPQGKGSQTSAQRRSARLRGSVTALRRLAALQKANELPQAPELCGTSPVASHADLSLGDSGHDSECAQCHGVGELICCEGDCCPAAFHLQCAGLATVPTGSWLCPSCQGDAGPVSSLRTAVTRPPEPKLPCAGLPMQITFREVLPTAITVQWKIPAVPLDSPLNATLRGYRLWYKKEGEEMRSPLPCLPQHVDSVCVTGLQPDCVYIFKVAMVTDQDLDGAESPECCCQTAPAENVADPPEPACKEQEWTPVTKEPDAATKAGKDIAEAASRAVSLQTIRDAHATSKVKMDENMPSGSGVQTSHSKESKESQREEVKVLRLVCQLEREGYVSKSFRIDFLMWFTLRASQDEKRAITLFIEALQEDLNSLAEQLQGAFYEAAAAQVKRLRADGLTGTPEHDCQKKRRRLLS
eukprot:SM000142S00514  [mRNA]  locus=s142:154705:160325:+ [translate_table: standard]